MIIKIVLSVNTVIIGNSDFCNLGIFINSATLHNKNKPKFTANQLKVYIAKN